MGTEDTHRGEIFFMFEDEEVICDIDDCIEVYSDCVKISLPDMPLIILTDDQLDYMFFHPESVNELCLESGMFWSDLVSFVYRTRKIKRDLYEELGFVNY